MIIPSILYHYPILQFFLDPLQYIQDPQEKALVNYDTEDINSSSEEILTDLANSMYILLSREDSVVSKCIPSWPGHPPSRPSLFNFLRISSLLLCQKQSEPLYIFPTLRRFH